MNTAMTELAEEVTAHAQMTNQSFPFVTVPLFEVNGRHAREQSGLESLAFCPCIDNDQDLADWGLYSVRNKGWLELSRTEVINHLPTNSSPPTYDQVDPMPFVFQIQPEGDVGAATPGRAVRLLCPSCCDENYFVHSKSLPIFSCRLTFRRGNGVHPPSDLLCSTTT